MRKHSVAIPLLILLGLAPFLFTVAPAPVVADEVEMVVDVESARELQRMTKAARLRTALDPVDPDTVWIGHVWDSNWRAKALVDAAFVKGSQGEGPILAGQPLPYLPGGYGPNKIGRGPNRQTNPFNNQEGWNGVWDFDRFQAGETDSLQGWWPVMRGYVSTGGANLPDWRRAWFAFDHGNQVNFVLAQPSHPRTFGVGGLWHRDGGSLQPAVAIPNTNPNGPTWAPINGDASAWCGIRAHGDIAVRERTDLGGTGNYFNNSIADMWGNNTGNFTPSSALGTDRQLPGYVSQLDQMIYRDIEIPAGATVNISFNYRTNMSTGLITAATTRTGWFHLDNKSPPHVLGVESKDGNFISSSTAGVNAPIDSFMVYIGVPVDLSNVTYSDGSTGDYTGKPDRYKQRLWFSEVLKIKNAMTNPVKESFLVAGMQLLGRAGTWPVTNASFSITPQMVDEIRAAQSGATKYARLVFRVKTNRAFDDEDKAINGFSSGTAGAAIIDDVIVDVNGTAWNAAEGNFENTEPNTPGVIDNRVSTPAHAAWKSTGKPPSAYWHAHDINDPESPLEWWDPCGSVTNPERICNMFGRVLSAGNHDDSEKVAGTFGTQFQEIAQFIVSPTINLMSEGNGIYNDMGIDLEIATASDYNLWVNIYTLGIGGNSITGSFYSTAYQSYPAKQGDGAKTWGELITPPFILSYTTQACLEGTTDGAIANGMIRTTNPANRPDSLRALIMHMTRCFSVTLDATTCANLTPPRTGVYFDGLSLALIDAPPPAPMSIAIWMMINDCFPANNDNALVTDLNPALSNMAFDTTAAQVRIGMMISQAGAGAVQRRNITGDTTIVVASGPDIRLDMVFRIKPGPGNYATLGNKLELIKRPDIATPVRNNPPSLATSSDLTDFWGSYKADPGPYSKGTHPAGDGLWSEHVWMSARCDSSEVNLFPASVMGNLPGLTSGSYASMLHEEEFLPLGEGLNGQGTGRRTGIAIKKPMCFVINAAVGQKVDTSNMTCDGTVPAIYGTPGSTNAGVPGSGADFGKTTEFTKILPDGQLTAGSHVQYFFRRSLESDPLLADQVFTAPDTNRIFPQQGTATSDGVRWGQFSVLPDRWKSGAWAEENQHAPIPACILFVDYQDRRGDERHWVAMADSMGATKTPRRGAHNGWKARGDQSYLGTYPDWDADVPVHTHGGQPGTIWDLYGYKAAESSTSGGGALGSRLAAQPTAAEFTFGKATRHGPTPAMLRYYRLIYLVSGDLLSGFWGPYANKTDDEASILGDFSSNATSGTALPRGVWFHGRSFVEGRATTLLGVHAPWVASFFGATHSAGHYRLASGSPRNIADLTVHPPLSSDGEIFGVASDCLTDNDVMVHSNQVTLQSVSVAKYEPAGATEYIAGIYAPPTAGHPHVSLINGWRISQLGDRNTARSKGRIQYTLKVLTGLFGSLTCDLSLGTPVGVGDMPNVPGYVNFARLSSENPWRSGPEAIIRFGLAKSEKVEVKLYDVSGRLVKTLVNRVFPAGTSDEHVVRWDGTNDDGQPVARGVYFYQLRTPSFTSEKKLAVLK